MITVQDLIKGRSLTSINPDIQHNLNVLVNKVNQLLAAWGKPVIVTSGYRTIEDHKRIYAAKGITNIPMRSKHLTGEAVDISDPGFKLTKWCKINNILLVKCGLYCEDDQSCARLHIQSVPPGSGRRWFKP